MSKHTPGPWTFSSETILDDGTPVHDEILCFHLQSDETVILDGCGCCNSPRLANPADARLIAAAPDLLEALQSLLDCAVYGFDMPSNHDLAGKARAAIAKARGEA